MRRDYDSGPEILRWLWNLICLPIVLLLAILEPVVAFALGALALLGVLTTIFFKLIAAPHFPVWTMLSISLGFALALVLYEGLLRALSE
jgi:hypothetical protein